MLSAISSELLLQRPRQRYGRLHGLRNADRRPSRSGKSGLRHAIEVLADVEEIRFNFFHSEDVVRHPVVARIVNAYEAWEEAEQKRKAALAAERKREEQEQK